MKRAYFVSLFPCLTLLCLTTSLFSQSNPVSLINRTAAVASPRVASPISASQADPKAQARILEGYGKLPLSFEANHGQADARVKFLSRTGGYTLFLTTDEAVLAWSGKKTKETSAQRLKPASLAGPGGTAKPTAAEPSTAEPPARGLRFVSGYRFSDTASPGTLEAPSGAGQRPSTLSADPEVVATGGVLRMKLRNANPAAKVTGVDELAGTSNYFIGNDPAKWRTKVPTYAKVKYEGIYPGIDLVYYGHQRELEYDFVLQPGANPQAIRLGIAGAKRLRLEHGDLVLTSAGGDVRLRSPHIYQEANGVRHDVRGRYLIKSKNEVGFEVAGYDRRRALVIDPVLAYSTYLGGSKREDAASIAVDSAGNAYVTGTTFSANFPTANAFQPAYAGGGDAFVTKINPDGTALIYSSYLGGSYGLAGGNGEDDGYGIAVDTGGSAYVIGSTQSSDFPTVNALYPCYGWAATQTFVTKVNASGNALVYSTCLPELVYVGEGSAGIAVDSGGNAYLTGSTFGNLPTVNAIQPVYGGTGDAFVMKINASGTAIVYSTYLGGSSPDGGSAIAVDSAGNAYVTGSTQSTDFPTANAIQPVYGGSGGIGDGDAFVTKINASGTAFVYSTYLGGSKDEWGQGITADGSGNAYVTGETMSSDFPTANAIQRAGGSYANAYVAKIKPDGTAFVYSTYLGESSFSVGSGIAADTTGNAYVTGTAYGSGFPTVNAIQSTFGGGYSNAFVTKFNADGSALIYSTYLGGKSAGFGAGDSGAGIAVDGAGSAYVTGKAQSANFPKSALAFQRLLKGSSDAFITKIAAQTSVGVSPLKLGFSLQVIGTTSATKNVTVTNHGPGNLTINKIYITGQAPGDFGETNTCGATLAPSASCTISVTFTPTAKNFRNAELAVSDSDPASPQAVALSGTGTFVSLSAKSLGFGKAPVGTTSPPKTVTLTNVGSTQLNFTAISITGTNAGDFSQTNTCGTSIAGGASCVVTVTFKPTVISMRTAAVSIYDDGGGSPQKVSLTGTGTSLAVTATALSSLPNPSVYGQAVTFTATVTSSSGAPPDGETTTFMKGTTVLGTGVLSGGSASFKTSALTAGTNSITAVYGGDSNLAGSKSKGVNQVVDKATITTTLTSSLNPSSFGQSVTFTAKVAPEFSGTVTGTVTFYDGTTALKIVGLSGGVAKYATSTLSSGSHTITAKYNGNVDFVGSSASLTQTVN
jgi:hypothetical protein